MIIKAIKVQEGYLIPELPSTGNLDKFIYLDVRIIQKDSKHGNRTSETVNVIELANRQLGGNKMLELKLKHLPRNYEYQEIESDDEILYQCLKEKYEL
jgi:hypothetical protein